MRGNSAIRVVTLLIDFLLVITLQALVQQPEAEMNSPADGNGEELMRTLCASCHSLERAVPGGRSRDEWERTVQDMVSRGARILSADAETIINYLAERYPVGTAPLQEMRLLVWVDHQGNVEPLAAPPRSYMRPRLSPDGTQVAVEVLLDKRDIWMLPFEGDRKPWLFLKTPALEGGIAFSADGRWLAHTSDETGQREIVVRAFPQAEPAHQVSKGGGIEVIWPPKSKDLFYRNGNKRMAVEINTTPTLTVGTPRVLFEGDFVPSSGSRANWDATADGQRFLMLKKVK